MNIVEQKLVAKKVLDKIKALDSRAIIAGGAPRDWYFGNLANDIDIFYFFETNTYCLQDIRQQLNILKCLLNIEDIKVLGIDPRNQAQWVDDFSNYIENPDIRNVYEATIDNVKFQFICLTKRNVQVGSFAYNMCQAWSNGVWIGTSKLFDFGVKKKLLIETGTLYANTDKFKKKMINKFPDYDYIKLGGLINE